MHHHWGQTAAKKKGTLPLWTAHIKQKGIAALTVVGWNNNWEVYIVSSQSSEPGVGKKLK